MTVVAALAPTSAIAHPVSEWSQCLRKLFSREPGPTEYWKSSPMIEWTTSIEANDRTRFHPFASISFQDQKGNRLTLPIERWSKDGNPVFLLPYGKVIVVPTQGILPRAREVLRSGVRAEDSTLLHPVFVSYEFNPITQLNRFVVHDGHHRYFLAHHQRSSVYVEMSGVSANPSPYVTFERWPF